MYVIRHITLLVTVSKLFYSFKMTFGRFLVTKKMQLVDFLSDLSTATIVIKFFSTYIFTVN